MKIEQYTHLVPVFEEGPGETIELNQDYIFSKSSTEEIQRWNEDTGTWNDAFQKTVITGPDGEPGAYYITPSQRFELNFEDMQPEQAYRLV